MKKKVVNTVFFAIIIYSFITSLRLLFSDRSLWLDEGMLAWSLSQRSFFELVSAPLEKMQSAPVLYLYIVKIITLLFGNTEVTLRIFSFICYAATIALSYLLGKRLRYPLALCAFISASQIMLRYSVEFKPYMCDCASVLLVLYLYMLYTEKKLNFSLITALFCIIIWLSNPACFFIAAILIFEFFKNPKKIFISGLFCVASFLVYFVFWLYPVIAKGDMTSYWSGQNFPLIPMSKTDIRTAFDMLCELKAPLGIMSTGIILLALFSPIKNYLSNKSPVIYVSVIGIFIAFAASFAGLFPIEDRLWLFIYPITALLAFEFVNVKELPALIISLALVLSSRGAVYYTDTENIFIPGDDLNPIIEYLKDKDDFIYVYEHSVPTYCYKSEYKTDDNVMLGSGYFNTYNPDLQEIQNQQSGYIVISHQFGDRTDGLFDALENDYNITVELENRETKLYYFTRKD